MRVGELRAAIDLLPATMPVYVRIGDLVTPLEAEELAPRPGGELTLVGWCPTPPEAAKPDRSG
jgi:hypothetical protein